VREGQLVTIEPVMRHQQPTRQPLLDFALPIGQGHLNEHGQTYNQKSIRAMVGRGLRIATVSSIEECFSMRRVTQVGGWVPFAEFLAARKSRINQSDSGQRRLTSFCA
jgi:hypothetical protein